MDFSEAGFAAKLREFQIDLSRPSEEVVQKHILTGSPAALTEAEYFTLRHEVALHFGVQPVEVVLVGSSKTGFTLHQKPGEDRPRYSRIGSSSDLDIAVVSSSLFDRFWNDVFEYSQLSAAFRASNESEEFHRMLFRGWVDPRGLPAGRGFEQANEWRRFFDGLSRDRRFGNRRASARIYRDWVRLAAYQRIAVENCKRDSWSLSE